MPRTIEIDGDLALLLERFRVARDKRHAAADDDRNAYDEEMAWAHFVALSLSNRVKGV